MSFFIVSMAAAGLMMEVVCPAELAPDRTLRIALPDAREFDVVVPDDVAVGDAFLVGPFPGPSVVCDSKQIA